jgi:hypothetical protein
MDELIRLRPTIIVAGNTAVAVAAERAANAPPV